jgi:hypothetical protein
LLELASGGGGHHRTAPGVGGPMISAVSMPKQVDRRGAEVGVAEPALDDVQRHALAGELDTVRVAESSIRA